MPNVRYSQEELVAREILRQLPDRARSEASLRGPAPGSRPVAPREEIELWNEKVGDPIDLYSKYMAEGADEDTAKTKATIEAYPNRHKMMLAQGTDPKEQARYASRMSRAAAPEAEPQGANDVSRPIY